MPYRFLSYGDNIEEKPFSGGMDVRYELKADMLERFRKMLLEEEKSDATIKKYMHDIQTFFRYAKEAGKVDKEMVMEYKKTLLKRYQVTSVNSILASLNRFFQCMNMYECTIKTCRVQREAFRSQDRELTKCEYQCLLRTALKKGKRRLYLLMQTICSTGIRVSELRFITVQAVHAGRASISMKGKTRTILLSSRLQQKLKHYIREKGIREGSVFVSRNGNPLDRSNILHEMKALCKEAGVDQRKVFPHNLRHLFACTYYKMEKDISHLADLLGHSNINTTRIYTRISGEEQIRQMDRLDLLFEK